MIMGSQTINLTFLACTRINHDMADLPNALPQPRSPRSTNCRREYIPVR